eukprot:scaffold1001_cov72-Phaeocystis_antarctica.AAC.5
MSAWGSQTTGHTLLRTLTLTLTLTLTPTPTPTRTRNPNPNPNPNPKPNPNPNQVEHGAHGSGRPEILGYAHP